MKRFLKYKIPLSLLFIYSLGLLSFFNSFNGEFVFDDFNSILNQNSIIKNLSLPEMLKIYSSRFIPYATFAVNYKLNGLNPSGYHAVNFAIHIVNAFLVYFLLILIQRTPFIVNSKIGKGNLLPTITAVMFAVHPVQTQAVNFISQRFTLIVCLFYLITLLFYLRSRFSKEKSGLVFYFLSLISFLFALFSKENSYTLPFVIVFIEVILFRNKINTKIILSLLPFLLISAVVFSAIYLKDLPPLQQVASLNMTHDSDITRNDYLLTQTNVVRKYLTLLILPLNQNADYDFPVSKSISEPSVVLSIFLILLLIISAIKCYRIFPLFSFGIAFFFTALLVESSLIPIKDVINEHRLYLPSVGFFIAAISIIIKYLKDKYLLPVTIVLILLFSFLSVRRNTVWRSEYNLWKDTVRKSPLKARPHYNLGVASYGINKFEEARQEFFKTITINPDYSDAYLNLGALYEQEKKDDKVIELYTSRLEDNHRDTKINAALASFYARKGKYEKAILQYEKILEYDSKNPLVYNDIGIIFFMQTREKEAINYFGMAVKLDPDYETAILNLANTYYHTGDDKNAQKYYSELIKINPESKEKIPLKVIDQE